MRAKVPLSMLRDVDLEVIRFFVQNTAGYFVLRSTCVRVEPVDLV